MCSRGTFGGVWRRRAELVESRDLVERRTILETVSVGVGVMEVFGLGGAGARGLRSRGREERSLAFSFSVVCRPMWHGIRAPDGIGCAHVGGVGWRGVGRIRCGSVVGWAEVGRVGSRGDRMGG